MNIRLGALLLAALCLSATPCLAAGQTSKGFKPASRGAVEGPKKQYHGNFKRMKYHNEFCDHYDCKTCT